MRLSTPSSKILSLLSLLSVGQAVHLLITVPPSPALPNPALLAPSTSASLTTLSHTYTASINTANGFSFRNVSEGSYLLDVYSGGYVFAPLRVDVSIAAAGEDGVAGIEEVQAWGTFRGNEWENKGEVVRVREVGKGKNKWSFEVAAIRAKEHFMERTGFSPLSMLKNPMILIAIAGMGLVFGMPKLLENMDPETRADFEEAQKSSPVAGLLAGGQPGANPMQNFDAAAWLAGSGKKPKDAAVGPEKGVGR